MTQVLEYPTLVELHQRLTKVLNDMYGPHHGAGGPSSFRGGLRGDHHHHHHQSHHNQHQQHHHNQHQQHHHNQQHHGRGGGRGFGGNFLSDRRRFDNYRDGAANDEGARYTQRGGGGGRFRGGSADIPRPSSHRNNDSRNGSRRNDNRSSDNNGSEGRKWPLKAAEEAAPAEGEERQRKAGNHRRDRRRPNQNGGAKQ
ncbi:hypothetical protein DQ04_02601010 [Trypanosoma grayi]|uniref:hypothetical protein n=1 Tax=Trypanosoma grayi TaxID=71804 RepID=UPI0004F3FC81|nr:hypothetical protein DQ04_02601010 [Trypanosoma grayi]KEG11454.1 hypothetical protein DQ04_02601010 [Trypanosoma grayi]